MSGQQFNCDTSALNFYWSGEEAPSLHNQLMLRFLSKCDRSQVILALKKEVFKTDVSLQ